MAFRAAPLPHEWMVISVIGFFISLLEIYPRWSVKWGFTFMVFFTIMFIASMVSVTAATTEPEHLRVLAVHHKNHIPTLKDRMKKE